MADQIIDTPPNRLCIDPDSPYFDDLLLQRGVGVRFNGDEKTNVEEYCVNEGWVRLTIGNKMRRDGKPMTMMFKGVVEPYFRS